jgi:hypothetical protein
VILDDTVQGTYLYRYDVSGAFVGDTWHASVDDANKQAAVEFMADLSPWAAVPADQVDPRAFAQGLANEDSTESVG